jgi:predicted unusual protein kinase regulating ubiquinone biosynthesis (AarF/ABC1/UbiB family)
MVSFSFDGQPLTVGSHISSKSSQVSLFFLSTHQGNILLLRDEDGSPALGLIDYGQVKQLSKETRHLFARLVIALDNDDKDQIVSLMKEAGMKTKNMNPEVIYLYAKVSYAEINDQILKGKHVQLFMEDLECRDPVVQLPRELLMVSRCTLLLRGLAQALHQNRNVATSWRPIAEKVLREDM